MVEPRRRRGRLDRAHSNTPHDTRRKKREWLLSRLESIIRKEIPTRDEALNPRYDTTTDTAGQVSLSHLDLQPAPQQGSGAVNTSILDATVLEPPSVIAHPFGEAQVANMNLFDTDYATEHAAPEVNATPPDGSTFRGNVAPQTGSYRRSGSTLVHSSLDLDIPQHLHGASILLRIVGPNDQAVVCLGRIEPDCDIAQVPGKLATYTGYGFDKRGTRGEIFPVMQQKHSFSSIGLTSPDFFIRDLGIMFGPESTVPDLRVNIYLAPTPERTDDGHLDMDQVNQYWDLPYVIISRPLLAKMIASGYQFRDLPARDGILLDATEMPDHIHTLPQPPSQNRQ